MIFDSVTLKILILCLIGLIVDVYILHRYWKVFFFTRSRRKAAMIYFKEAGVGRKILFIFSTSFIAGLVLVCIFPIIVYSLLLAILINDAI